jgi:Protein of unknown function (DUF3160)
MMHSGQVHREQIIPLAALYRSLTIDPDRHSKPGGVQRELLRSMRLQDSVRRTPILLALACLLALPPTSALAAAAPEHGPIEAISSADPGASCRRDLPQQNDSEAVDESERLASSKNPCAVADDNLAREEAEILRPKPPAAAAPQDTWDHKSRPQFLEAILQRFELQPAELTVINRTGFAVPARLEVPSYTHGYHEIFQSQLPVYITADSIFHAIFASHQTLVARLETLRLSPMLSHALDEMHCALLTAAPDYPTEVVRDLDLYLLVARRLIADPDADADPPRSAFADDTVEHEADELVAKAMAASELATLTLFGRPRLVDFTQYEPRGHYADKEALQRYFRAAMWASRLEFNLVSRSSRSSEPGPAPDPRETPREAIAALALADLAARSGAAKSIADLDAAWGALAGPREDVSIAQLAELRVQVGSLTDANAFEKLKAAIGDRFHRTTRLHPMPEGSRELPAIATLIGPRIVADAGALMLLVNSAVPDRHWPDVADVAYTFGLDRAKTYLAKDLAAFPTLNNQLEAARAQMANTPVGDDLYSAWLAAIRALAKAPVGTLPSFLNGEAGEDLRLNTIAAAYGQLKHNYVLVAGQPYADFGCEIPDGYVEPVPATYDALIAYAGRGAELAALLDPEEGTGVRAHFARVGQVLRVLHAIVDDELAGRALTGAERRWLGMVAELSLDLGAQTTGYPPMYTGWYFDLFLDRQADGMRGTDYIADYFTSQEGVAYVGATAPRLGIFVVDTGGPPRAFVGPVARAYEVHGPLGARYSDETARTLAQRDEPWAAGYTIPAAAPPSSLQLRYDAEARQFVLTSDRALGRATIKALDHHHLAVETVRTMVKKGETRVAIKKKRIAGVSVRVGEFRDFVAADTYGGIRGQWGTPPPEQ